jgi:hypothetical protein
MVFDSPQALMRFDRSPFDVLAVVWAKQLTLYQLTIREAGTFLVCFGGPAASEHLAATTPRARRRRRLSDAL